MYDVPYLCKGNFLQSSSHVKSIFDSKNQILLEFQSLVRLIVVGLGKLPLNKYDYHPSSPPSSS